MQSDSMRAWKEAYRVSITARERQANEFELSDADLEIVHGSAGTSTTASATSTKMDQLKQLNSSYLQGNNGSVLPLGIVTELTSGLGL